MKKLKKYKVVCRLDSYAMFECEAPDKKTAKAKAERADRKGELFFGDEAMSVIEVTEVK
jgi:hypothetical protein